jgi:hypothetical protein
MTNPFKNLFSRRSRREEALTKKVEQPLNLTLAISPLNDASHSLAVPSPLPSDGRREGEAFNLQPTTTYTTIKRAHVGKIGRLPEHIQLELNRHLANNTCGLHLIAWLNGLPEVRAILARDFGGRPINSVNLTKWRKGGYHDWKYHRDLTMHVMENRGKPFQHPPILEYRPKSPKTFSPAKSAQNPSTPTKFNSI